MATSPAPDAAAPPGMCPGIAVLGGGGGSGDGDGDGSGGKDGAGGDGQGAPDYEKYPPCGYASHPVDVVTGRAFTHPITDLELPGPLPLSFKRMYSSKMAGRDTGLGYGWGHTFGWEIEVQPRRIRVWNEQGMAVDFPVIDPANEVIGPWGWLLRRDRGGFALDVDDGVWRLFVPADEGGKRYRLAAVEDRNRNKIALTYEQGRLVEVVDSAGRVIRLPPTKEGRIGSIEVKNAVAQGRWVAFATYTYDDQGNLAAARDADGFASHYAYDEEHRLTADEDRTGLTFHFVYDQKGRCVESWGDYPGKVDPSLAEGLPKVLADGVTRAKGIHHCRFDYHADGYSEVADSTQVRRFFGNKHGSLDKSVEGGAVNTATFRDDGHVLSQTDPMGGTTTFERDARGRELAVADPLGRLTRTQRDAAGFPVQIMDAAGSVTTFTRDRFGNIEARMDASGAVTSYRYDARGLVTERVTPDGARIAFAYDAEGNRIRVSLPGGREHYYWYDRFGRCVSETDPEGVTTHFAYSNRGDLTAVSNGAGEVTRYEYDGERHLTTTIDARGRRTSVAWGGYHRICSRENPSGGRVELRYDLEGQLVEVRNERGEAHRLEYDRAGKLVGETTFDGRRFRYKNDAMGRPVRVESDAGLTTIEYDLAGQLLKREAGDTTQEFAWSPLGRLLTAKNPDSEIRFTWDALGRLVGEAQRVGDTEHSVAITYAAAAGRVSRDTSLGHTLSVERDASGASARTVLDGSAVIEHRFDRLGREVARLLPGGGAVETVFDAIGRVVKRRARTPTAHRPSLRGQPDWIGPVVGDAAMERSYRYDDRNELVEAWDAARGGTRYDYDPVGRLLSALSEGSPPERFRYDATGNPYEIAPGAAPREYGAGSRLLRRGDAEYVWDAAGRLVEKRVREADTCASAVWRYAWNDAGLLRQVTTPDGTLVDFTYDALARRMQKRVSRAVEPGGRPVPVALTRFVWDGDALVHEIEQTARAAGDPVVEVRTYLFDRDGHTPLAHRDGADPGAEWFHYVNSPIGAPEALVDGSGKVACEIARRVNGAADALPGGRTSTPFGLPGQYVDPEIGLSYNRFRYYDPETAAYVSPDPLGLDGGLNPYAYAQNPLRWADPLGLAGYATWNDFQAGTAGQYASRQEAATAWKVYKETNRSCDTPAIGRLADTSVASTMGYRRLNTTGWTLGVNDAWMQGGIDRKAPFYLASPDTPGNRLTPPGSTYPTTVFDRELNQLSGAGYTRSACGTYMLPPGMTSPPP